jgi:putative spermidine/putrescine transport system substrate-binding protein
MSQHHYNLAKGISLLSRRRVLKDSAVLGLALTLLSCRNGDTSTPDNAPVELLASEKSIALDVLIPEARREGYLSIMSAPRYWANYGGLIDGYREKFEVAVNELKPEGSSSDGIAAMKQYRGQKTPFAPDVMGLGLGFADTGKQEGLFAKYKVATWDSIPAGLKDPEGYWFGSYYGVLGFEVNRAIVNNVPQDWADLLKPEYKGMVALAGDPTKSSTAYSSVWAAGLAQGASLDEAPMAGLEFFKALHQAGNLIPVIGRAESLVKGETPIVISWDFLALGDSEKMKGQADIAAVVPASGVFGLPYIQTVNASASHPFAGRLWQEWLYSDEGQLTFLEGYAHPIRYNDLVRRGVIPDELAARLPPPELYAKAVFPTSPAQADRVKVEIAENWLKVVGVEVKAPA